MKKLITAALCAAAILILASCTAEVEILEPAAEAAENSRTELYVDLSVNGDGYYSLMGSAELVSSEAGIERIHIYEPVLLAFAVSSEYGGGAWLMDMDKGTEALEQLRSVAGALREAGEAELAERIDAVIAIISTSGPYTDAGT